MASLRNAVDKPDKKDKKPTDWPALIRSIVVIVVLVLGFILVTVYKARQEARRCRKATKTAGTSKRVSSTV
jgi:hypothetical protein